MEKTLSAPAPGAQIQAVPAAPGIAFGPAHVHVLPVFDYPAQGESQSVEHERLHSALAQVRIDIEQLIQRSTAKAIREIFVTHQEMLADPELVDEVAQRLKQGESAAAAWMTRHRGRRPSAGTAQRCAAGRTCR